MESIDISGITQLEDLVEEARRSKRPVVLRRGSEIVAEIVPFTSVPVRPVKQRTPEGHKAFRQSAGSWESVDVDEFLTDVYENRRLATKPAVEL